MYKATISFSGIISMAMDEIREIPDEEIANDLLRAGYIVKVTDEPAEQPKKTSRKKAK